MEANQKEIKSLLSLILDNDKNVANLGKNKSSSLLIDETKNPNDLFKDVIEADAEKDKTFNKMLSSKKALIDYVWAKDKFELCFEQLRSYLSVLQSEATSKEMQKRMKQYNEMIKKIGDDDEKEEKFIIKNKSKIMQYLKDKELASYRRWFNCKYFNNTKHLPSASDKQILRAIGGTGIVDRILNAVLSSAYYCHLFPAYDSKGKPFTKFDKNTINDPAALKSFYKYEISSFIMQFPVLTELIYAMYIRCGQQYSAYKFDNRFDYQMHTLEIDSKLGKLILQQSYQFKDLFTKFREVVDYLFAHHIGTNDIEPWNRYQTEIMKQCDIEISKKQACIDCVNALQVLGDEYVKCFNTIIDENWVDWDYKGPQTNYSMSGRGNYRFPIRINFENNVNDGSMTLIHEAGHSINAMLCKDKGIYSGIQFLNAEIPGFVNEALLFCYYMDQKYKDNANGEHFILIYNYMNRLYNNLCENPVSTLAANAWDELIEKADKQLTFSDFVHAYREVLKTYGGATKDEQRWMVAKDDKDCRNIYDHKEIVNVLYGYQNPKTLLYFFGALIGTSIGIDIYYGKNNMKEKYLNFLRNGQATDPITALKNMGFDVTLNRTYDRLVKWIGNMLNEFIDMCKSGSKDSNQEEHKTTRKLVRRQ